MIGLIKEEWLSVVGYEGFYEVSNLGEVRGLDRVINVTRKDTGTKLKRPIKGRLLKQTLNEYMHVHINKEGKKKTSKVHVLVCTAFHGERKPKQQVNHIDGNKLNNKADNLEWCYQTENMRHAVKMGLINRSNIPKAVITDEQVKWIVANQIPFDKEFSNAAIAKRFGVTASCISKIVSKHRPKEEETNETETSRTNQ